MFFGRPEIASSRSITSRRLALAAATVAALAPATVSLAQIAYVTTENRAVPVGVFYRDAGTWIYAGAFPGVANGGPDATYGITRNGGDLFIGESSQGSPTLTAGRLLKVGANGTGLTTLFTAGTGLGAGIKGNIQGMQVGPDGKLYFSTAFGGNAGVTGGPSGIWRVNTDGTGLENIIPLTSVPTPSDGSIRDFNIADLDGNPANGFDIFFGTRGGTREYHTTINGATLGTVDTLTTTAASPNTSYYDSITGKLYIGSNNTGVYHVASLDPLATGQTPTIVIPPRGDVDFDLTRIDGNVLSLSSTAASGLALRYVTGGTPGAVYADFSAISGGAIATGRQIAIVDSSELATATFNGAGGDNNLSTNGNFAGGTAPNFAQVGGFAPRITFGASPRTAITVSSPARVGSLTFIAGAPAYTISGSAITVDFAGGVSNLSSNTQTFNAPLNIAGGGIAAIGGNLVFNGDVTSVTGGLLTLSGAGNITFNGKLSGGGNIDKSNTGSLILANAGNDFTGTLGINHGALVIDSVNAQSGLGASTSSLSAGGGTLDGVIKLANNVSVNRTVVLPGRSAQPSPAAANTFLPQVEATGGSNSLTTLGLTGGNTASVVQADAGAELLLNAVENRAASNGASGLRVQGAGTTRIVGTVGGGTSSGVITVTKAGSGLLDVSTATYGTAGGLVNAGSYIVQGGTVLVGALTPSSAARPTSVTVDAGATFDATPVGNYQTNIGQTFAGSGTIKVPNITFYDDTIVNPGNTSDGSRVGTLNVNGNLELQNAANAAAPGGLNFDLSSSNALGANDRIAVSGALTVTPNAGSIAVNVFSLNGTYQSGAYRLIDHTGTVNGTPSFVAKLTGGTANYRQTFAVDTSTAGQVNLVVSGAAKALAWHGDGTAGGAKFDVGTSANFRDGATPSTFLLGDTVQFTDDATADGTAILQAPIIGRIDVNAARDYTIKNIADYDTVTTGAQPSGFTEGTTLTKSGSGTLTVDSTGGLFPNWAGSLVISGGVYNATGALGGIASLPFGVGLNAQAITTLDGGTLRLSGAAAGATGRTFTLTQNGGTIDTLQTEAFGTGGLPAVMSGSGNRTLTLTSSGTTAATLATFTFSGSIGDPTSGSTGITKNSTNAVVLNGQQSYSGALTINAGRFTIGDITGLGTSAGATSVSANAGLVISPATIGTYTTGESFTLAGTGAITGLATTAETTGALRLTGVNTLTTTGNVSLVSNTNVGVDDANGSLILAGNTSGTGGLNKVGAGKLTIGSGTAGTIRTTGSLSLTAGSLKIDSAGTQANHVTGLTIGTGLTLDLSKSKLVVDYDAATPFDAIQAAVISGYAGGTWNGTGIRSSFAATNSRYGIGVIEAGSTGVPTNYLGTTTDSTSVIVGVSLLGDFNLSNVVDFDDLLILAKNYGATSGKTWGQGDTDYNGGVDFNDLLALAKNYSGTAFNSAQTGQLSASIQSDFALARSLVPEPTTLGLLGGLSAMAGRRRRAAK